MKTFIGVSAADRAIVEPFVEMLRLHYIDFFYSDRALKGGYFAEDIEKAIDQCRKFIVFISPNAMKSEWVPKEVAMAMSREHLRGKVLPILITDTPNWTELHPHISKLQKFDHFREPREVETRIVEGEFNRPRHQHPYYRFGDVTVQVLILAGGDGETRFNYRDIVCNGPKKERTYELPADIQSEAEVRIAKKKADCDAAGALFIDNPQIRLIDATQGGSTAAGGIENKPLRLTLGWTNYYSTYLTNMTRDYVLPCGQEEKVSGPDLGIRTYIGSDTFSPSPQCRKGSRFTNPALLFGHLDHRLRVRLHLHLERLDQLHFWSFGVDIDYPCTDSGGYLDGSRSDWPQLARIPVLVYAHESFHPGADCDGVLNHHRSGQSHVELRWFLAVAWRVVVQRNTEDSRPVPPAGAYKCDSPKFLVLGHPLNDDLLVVYDEMIRLAIADELNAFGRVVPGVLFVRQFLPCCIRKLDIKIPTGFVFEIHFQVRSVTPAFKRKLQPSI
jgi:TIR domain